jgi:hypothetical protein
MIVSCKSSSGFFFPNSSFTTTGSCADFMQQKYTSPTGLPSSSSSGPSTPLTARQSDARECRNAPIASCFTDEICAFFVDYNKIRNRDFEQLDVCGPKKAMKIVDEGMKVFKSRHRKNGTQRKAA